MSGGFAARRNAKGGDVRRATAAGWLLVFWVAALVACCATVVPEPVVIREPRPECVPLVIGAHHSQEFRRSSVRLAAVTGRWRTFAVGEPSVKLLDEALTLLFARVVEVSEFPPKIASESAVAGVIEPRIAEVSITLSRDRQSQRVAQTSALITYVFTLYSREGQQLASWQVSGRGVENLPHVGTHLDWPKVVGKPRLEQAMREAAWKLTSEFRSVPGVPRWLHANGVK